MNTPLMNQRNKLIDTSSPINTPNINSTLFQGRKMDIKNMHKNSILNKYTNNQKNDNKLDDN